MSDAIKVNQIYSLYRPYLFFPHLLASYVRVEMYLVVGFVPVANKDGVIIGGSREWDRDLGAAGDTNSSKCAGGFVKSERREIVETSDLIFNLKSVGVVLPWWDWARRSVHSVLERIFRILNPAPLQKK